MQQFEYMLWTSPPLNTCSLKKFILQLNFVVTCCNVQFVSVHCAVHIARLFRIHIVSSRKCSEHSRSAGVTANGRFCILLCVTYRMRRHARKSGTCDFVETDSIDIGGEDCLFVFSQFLHVSHVSFFWYYVICRREKWMRTRAELPVVLP